MKGDKIFYEAGYKYQLHQDYRVRIGIFLYEFDHEFFSLTKDGWLTIKAGYAWDGASGAIDTKTIMRGSLVHDVLFQAMRAGLLPQTCFPLANLELKKICLEDGMWQIRADWVFKAVSDLGKKFAKIQNEHVLAAP